MKELYEAQENWHDVEDAHDAEQLVDEAEMMWEENLQKEVKVAMMEWQACVGKKEEETEPRTKKAIRTLCRCCKSMYHSPAGNGADFQ